MLKVTIKVMNKTYDLEFDENQEIIDIINVLCEEKKIEQDEINKIRLTLDKRTIDVKNTFKEMEIKNNEIITIL